MAGYNEIQVGRYNRFLQKLLSLKGMASMNELSTTLQLSLSAFHGNENRYLEAWDLFALTENLAPAGAGNINGYYLRNPAGSNVVAVLTRLNTLTGLSQNMTVRYRVTGDGAIAGSTPGVSAQALDARTQRSNTQLQNVFEATAANPLIGQPIYRATPPVGVAIDVILNDPEDELPLLPGTTIQIQSATANDSLVLNFRWRERFLEDSERS